MRTDRIPAGVLPQAVDCGPDCRQTAASGRTGAGLGEPTRDGFKVCERRVRIAQLTLHEGAELLCGKWRRPFAVGADAVDPGLHVGRVHEPAGFDVGVGGSDLLRLASESTLPLGFEFRAMFGNGGRIHTLQT
jgi:hypothetical protein